MKVEIAGLAVMVHAGEPLAEQLESAFSAFATDRSATAVLDVATTGAPAPGSRRARAVPSVERHGDRVLVRGDDFRGEVTAESLRVEGKAERFPTDSVLKVWLADRLLEHDGLLLHGCAVAGTKGALVFVGDSGAGKSTLAQLASEGGLLALADELCAVRWEDGAPIVHGTPWNAGVPRSARLLGIGVLAHARSHVLEAAPSVDVLRALLPNALLPDTGAEGRTALFRAAARLLSAVGTYRLSFGLHPGVADALSPLVGARR